MKIASIIASARIILLPNARRDVTYLLKPWQESERKIIRFMWSVKTQVLQATKIDSAKIDTTDPSLPSD